MLQFKFGGIMAEVMACNIQASEFELLLRSLLD